MFEFHGTMRGQ